MTFFKNHFRIKIILLLCLFVGYQYRVITLAHLHIIKDQIIVHTHPYSDTSETQHTHTLRELSELDIKISKFFYMAHPVPMPVLFLPILYKIDIPAFTKEKDPYRFLRHFRGPPQAIIN